MTQNAEIPKEWFGRVECVAVSPDGQVIASGGWSNTIRLWNISTGQLFRTLTGEYDTVWSVAFSPDGKTLASGGYDIKLWEITTGQVIQTLKDMEIERRGASRVTCITFSPDGKRLVTGNDDEDYNLKVWSLETGQLVHTITGHWDYVCAVAVSPDEETIASCGKYNIILSSLKTGQAETLGTQPYSRSVAFSPDGQLVASGGSREIKLWSVKKKEVLRTLTGHSGSGYVESLAFSPDGQILASGSSDHTIKLWRLDNGELLHTLTGHSDWVNSVAFTPDGQNLVSGSNDKTVKLWALKYSHRTFVASSDDEPPTKTDAELRTINLDRTISSQVGNFNSQGVNYQGTKTQDVNNQCVNFFPDQRVLLWKGLRFRSKAEIKIAEALDRLGVLYYPNCIARLCIPNGPKNLESDFLVCCETPKGFKWGILEVDGPFHTPERRVEEQERERVFEHSGVRVYRFDWRKCENQPDNVVRELIELLSKAY